MAKRSKLYRSRLELVDADKAYSLEEAVGILKSMPQAKFDESVEIAVRLGVDTRKSDQNVRGALSLPNGTGKSITVVVIASGDAADAANEAGADHVGFDDLIEKIKGGWVDFDVLIATPAAMAKLRTLGRVLGPRGLMPNPKTGTVTQDTASAVKQAKGGRVEYRADKGGVAHVMAGKVSFDANKIIENVESIITELKRAKPASSKGIYLLSCTLSSTMSPGIKLDTQNLRG